MTRRTRFIHRFAYTVAAADVAIINAALTRHGYGPCIHIPLSQAGSKEDTPTHYTGIITLDDVGLAIFRRIFAENRVAVDEKDAADPITKKYLSVNECTTHLDLKRLELDLTESVHDVAFKN